MPVRHGFMANLKQILFLVQHALAVHCTWCLTSYHSFFDFFILNKSYKVKSPLLLQMLEAALLHLLEGRHVVEANEDFSHDKALEIKAKFWNQLQALLKSMLAASLSGSKPGTIGQTAPCHRATDPGKLKEMYRLSLKSNCLGQLHALHRLWFS